MYSNVIFDNETLRHCLENSRQGVRSTLHPRYTTMLTKRGLRSQWGTQTKTQAIQKIKFFVTGNPLQSRCNSLSKILNPRMPHRDWKAIWATKKNTQRKRSTEREPNDHRRNPTKPKCSQNDLINNNKPTVSRWENFWKSKCKSNKNWKTDFMFWSFKKFITKEFVPPSFPEGRLNLPARAGKIYLKIMFFLTIFL